MALPASELEGSGDAEIIELIFADPEVSIPACIVALVLLGVATVVQFLGAAIPGIPLIGRYLHEFVDHMADVAKNWAERIWDGKLYPIAEVLWQALVSFGLSFERTVETIESVHNVNRAFNDSANRRFARDKADRQHDVKVLNRRITAVANGINHRILTWAAHSEAYTRQQVAERKVEQRAADDVINKRILDWASKEENFTRQQIADLHNEEVATANGINQRILDWASKDQAYARAQAQGVENQLQSTTSSLLQQISSILPEAEAFTGASIATLTATIPGIAVDAVAEAVPDIEKCLPNLCKGLSGLSNLLQTLEGGLGLAFILWLATEALTDPKAVNDAVNNTIVPLVHAAEAAGSALIGVVS